jgi:hypothetical protein
MGSTTYETIFSPTNHDLRKKTKKKLFILPGMFCFEHLEVHRLFFYASTVQPQVHENS